jgi:hypothetical protein
MLKVALDLEGNRHFYIETIVLLHFDGKWFSSFEINSFVI